MIVDSDAVTQDTWKSGRQLYIMIVDSDFVTQHHESLGGTRQL